MKNDERQTAMLRLAAGTIMVLCGALTVALTLGKPEWSVMKEIGGAFVVAGVIAIFTEFAFGYWAPKKATGMTFVETGMRMLCGRRAGLPDYHTWLLNSEPQELSFAGRSVLHRMKRDFEYNALPSVEAALIHQLRVGSTIDILFLDPTWDTIDQLAVQEGRVSPRELYADLLISWKTLGSLWQEIESAKQGIVGEIHVYVCRNANHYAYHCVKDGKHNRMLVGFYFAKKLGWETPVFEVVDHDTKEIFREHFANLCNSAKTVLFFSRRGAVMQFERDFYEQGLQHLISKTAK